MIPTYLKLVATRQALRRAQRAGARAPRVRRRGQRARSARDLPAGLRGDGAGGRRLFGHGRVQPRQRGACCASKLLLQDILRDEWGFEGYVVSDCGAIRDIHANHKVVDTPAEAAAAGGQQWLRSELRRDIQVAARRAGEGADRRGDHRRRRQAALHRAVQAGHVRSARARALGADPHRGQRLRRTPRAGAEDGAGVDRAAQEHGWLPAHWPRA